MKLCGCGCGNPVRRSSRTFLHGHYWKKKTRAERTAQARKGVETRRARGATGCTAQ
jgi:hypothetical protein